MRTALRCVAMMMAIGGYGLTAAAWTSHAEEAAALVDAEGRSYVIERLPKAQAVRIDDHTVRGPWGVPLEVLREDTDAYQVKRYRMSSGAPGESPPAAAATADGTAAEGRRAAGATVRRSDRLRFRPFAEGLPRAGQWRDGFAIADMNGDGHADVVHGPARKSFGAPVVFLGDGRGHWRRWSEARFASRPYDYGDAQAGDVNGDGHVDLVLAVHLRGLIALVGDGHGEFKDASSGLDFGERPGAAGFSSRAIRLADWDGDHRPDIVALGEGPRLAVGGASSGTGLVVYLNRGERWERRDGGTDRRVFGQSLAVADFDADGRLDAATGCGILGRTDVVNLGLADGGWRTTEVPVPPRSYVRAVAARDLDGDGRADLAVAYLQRVGTSWRTGIDVLYPRADASWQRRSLLAEDGRAGTFALAVGDLDGDAHGDLVALTRDGDTLVFAGDGRGFFTREAARIPRFPGGCQGSHVELADLDGDGRDEIVASFAEEHASIAAKDRCPSGGGITAWKVQ